MPDRVALPDQWHHRYDAATRRNEVPEWSGWRYDLQLKQIYADQLSAGLAALSPNMAADWLQSRGAVANKGALSGLAQQAWSWLTTRGFDQAIRDVVQQVLGNLWAEGFAVGRESAKEQLSAGYDSTFWSEWKPGDADAARLVAGNGLQQLLDDYGVQTIKSVTQTRMHDLADALAEGFEDGDSADTIAKSIEQILSNPQRALMVAGTELNRATTQASVAEYRKADQDGKKWSSAKDDRVCPHCKRNVEQGVIPIDQAYDTGDTFTPGHPECRCAILPKRLPADQNPIPQLNLVKAALKLVQDPALKSVAEEYVGSGLTMRDFWHDYPAAGPYGWPAVSKHAPYRYRHGWIRIDGADADEVKSRMSSDESYVPSPTEHAMVAQHHRDTLPKDQAIRANAALFDDVKSRKQAAADAQVARPGGRADLSEDDKDAISRVWYGKQYKETATHLRSDGDLRPDIETFKDAIARSEPFEQDTTLYRDVTSASKVFGKTPMAEGHVFSDKSFVSTTANENDMRGYDPDMPAKNYAKVIINARKGTKALKADQDVLTRATSQPGSGQISQSGLNEYVLPPGSQFKVASDVINDNGYRVIHLEVGP